MLFIRDPASNRQAQPHARTIQAHLRARPSAIGCAQSILKGGWTRFVKTDFALTCLGQRLSNNAGTSRVPVLAKSHTNRGFHQGSGASPARYRPYPTHRTSLLGHSTAHFHRPQHRLVFTDSGLGANVRGFEANRIG